MNTCTLFCRDCHYKPILKAWELCPRCGGRNFEASYTEDSSSIFRIFSNLWLGLWEYEHKLRTDAYFKHLDNCQVCLREGVMACRTGDTLRHEAFANVSTRR